MIFKTELFILVLLTVVAVHTTQAALKCNCQVKRCATTTNCKFGTHKDSCGCCDVSIVISLKGGWCKKIYRCPLRCPLHRNFRVIKVLFVCSMENKIVY